MIGITAQAGTSLSNECPDCPGAGPPKRPAIPADPGSLVLKAYSRVSGKLVTAMVFEDPIEGTIRKRPFPVGSCIGREVGVKAACDDEHGAPGIALLPEVVTITLRGDVKVRCFGLKGAQAAMRHVGSSWG